MRVDAFHRRDPGAAALSAGEQPVTAGGGGVWWGCDGVGGAGESARLQETLISTRLPPPSEAGLMQALPLRSPAPQHLLLGSFFFFNSTDGGGGDGGREEKGVCERSMSQEQAWEVTA